MRRFHFYTPALGLLLAIIALMLSHTAQAQLPVQTPLDPALIPKYVEPLPHFAGYRVSGTNLTVSMHEFQEKVLPADLYDALPAPYNAGTYVWGYQVNNGSQTFGPYYPGFTVEATRGVPTTMTYVNTLPLSPVLQSLVPIDQTLHWANPLGWDMMDPRRMDPYTGPPPAVPHLHGGEVPSEFDGGPDAWFTPDGRKGAGYRSAVPSLTNSCVYRYPNDQDATTLWFHDHALGATRINVYRGLAAFYLLRDWWSNTPGKRHNGLERPDLPGGPADTTVTEPDRAIFPNNVYKPEIELAIQDRMFDDHGQLYFPHDADNPDVHPLWLPEFFGNVMLVNGKSWPYLHVEPRRYRFRVLDGCNARFLNMWLQNDQAGAPGPVIWQIGSDGGLLNHPVKLDPGKHRTLFLAPGERADIIIDFRGCTGQTLTLHNDAAAPYPAGDPEDPAMVGQIMQFRVGQTTTNRDMSYNPATGQSPRMSPLLPINPAGAVVKRQLTLNEVELNDNPEEVLVNNTKWSGKRPVDDGMLAPIDGFVLDGQGDYLSELPKVGTTEIWEFINLTMDAHPIHLHLVQFQLLSRQDFDPAYFDAYAAAFPGGYHFEKQIVVPPGEYIPAFGPPLKYNKLNADRAVGGNPAISRYCIPGTLTGPLPEEQGWKDTIKVYPGQVTRIAVRFTQQDGSPFTFDATGTKLIAYNRDDKLDTGPGYVWHCHIVDHEDNEMMRPFKPVK